MDRDPVAAAERDGAGQQVDEAGAAAGHEGGQDAEGGAALDHVGLRDDAGRTELRHEVEAVEMEIVEFAGEQKLGDIAADEMAGEVGGRRRRAHAGDIGRGAIEFEAVIGEFPHRLPAQRRPVEGDGDIDFPRGEGIGARQGDEFEFELGVSQGDGAQPAADIGGAEAFRRADAHPAREVLRPGAEAFHLLQHQGFDGLRRRQKLGPRRGQADAAARPLEQKRAEFGFQPGQPAADGRMIDVQRPRRLAHAAVARHLQKYADIVPVHRFVRQFRTR